MSYAFQSEPECIQLLFDVVGEGYGPLGVDHVKHLVLHEVIS